MAVKCEDAFPFLTALAERLTASALPRLGEFVVLGEPNNWGQSKLKCLTNKDSL